MTTELIQANRTARIEHDGAVIELGQWYIVRVAAQGRARAKAQPADVFACVYHIGTNYVLFDPVGEDEFRVHLSEFNDRCTRVDAPREVISGRIAEHQQNVRELMAEVQRVTALIGVVPAGAIGAASEGTETTALAVAHGTADIKAHKAALVKAKEKTLPDLFKQIETQHAHMAMWMKAELTPMKAQFAVMKTCIEAVENRIFTVELYAGLTEEVVQLKDGNPATNDTKVSLFQRRHYMDEECLVNYAAGGMEFKDVKAFDRWLIRKDNLSRILPLERCVVAFRVRRYDKHYKIDSIAAYVTMWYEQEAARKTYIYIRNGEQVYRLSTGIDFGEELFPDREHDVLLGHAQKLYGEIDGSRLRAVISAGRYAEIMDEYKREDADYLKAKAAWDAKSEAYRKKEGWHAEPRRHDYHFRKTYEEITPASVYYDDAINRMAREALAHNRVAVVIQGLLDRSPALQPHPPWRIWTPEGFSAGIDLVYDSSRGMTSGPPPDFEAYRKRVNAKIDVGTFVTGQLAVFEEYHKERAEYESRLRRYRPDHGRPTRVHKVARMKNGMNEHDKPTIMCEFHWERDSDRGEEYWEEDPKKPGWGWNRKRYKKVTEKWSCDWNKLLNVSAYVPGDYKQFYADPRTRAEYLQWAPLLLAAEDWHAAQKATKEPK